MIRATELANTPSSYFESDSNVNDLTNENRLLKNPFFIAFDSVFCFGITFGYKMFYLIVDSVESVRCLVCE